MATGVSHDSSLAQELVDEHRALLGVFGRLKTAAEASEAAAFKRALQEFKALLIPHVMKEAYKVYTYLRQQTKDQGDLDAYQRVTAYKKEMTGIGDAALQFVEIYTQAPDESIDFEQVRASLRQIGHLLGDRIRREESELYPLYQSLH